MSCDIDFYYEIFYAVFPEQLNIWDKVHNIYVYVYCPVTCIQTSFRDFEILNIEISFYSLKFRMLFTSLKLEFCFLHILGCICASLILVVFVN
jgi:hypothetical protein